MRDILDLVESDNYEDALKKTNTIFSSTTATTADEIFKIGIKLLYKIITTKLNNINETKYLLFKSWLEYSLEYNQSLLSKHSIIHYAISYTKHLINNQIYGDAISILMIIDQFYSFDSIYALENEGKKFLKYTTSLCQNEATRLLNSKQQNFLEYTLKLIEFVVKLNLKLKTNPITIYDTLTIYQIQFLKYSQQLTQKLQNDFKLKYDKFYSNLLDYLNKNINSRILTTKPTIIYLNNFKLILKTSYLSSLFIELKLNTIDYYIEKFTQNSNTTDDLVLLDLLNYLKKLDGLISSKTKSSRTFSVLSDDENKISKKLDGFTSVMEIFIGLCLLDFFLSYLLALSNQLALSVTLLNQIDNFLKFVSNLCILNIKLVKLFYNMTNNDNADVNCINLKCLKQMLFKPLNQFYNLEKLFESNFKINNPTKSVNPNIKQCQQLLVKHSEYIEWLECIKYFQTDEIWKFYNNLESCSMRISSHFLSDSVINESIEFQRICFKISTLKLESALTATTNTQIFDETIFKNLQYITDNLLLSLRMAELYFEAIDVLNELNKFLKKFNLDLKYIELILTNWCKIKRDAAKIQTKSNTNGTSSTKTNYEQNLKYKTIDKLMKTLNQENIIDYLFEELRILKYFCSLDSSIQMYDEILCVLNEIYKYLDSLSDAGRYLNEITNKKSTSRHNVDSLESTIKIDVNLNKCRLYLELAQFFWLKHMCTQNDYFKNSISYQLTNEQCLDLANNSLKMHKCKTSLTRSTKTKCTCVDYKIIKFQINLYKMLNEYACYRETLCKSIKNLIVLRLKMKSSETMNTLTNADNLQHISSTQSSLKYLLCSEIHSTTAKEETNFEKQLYFINLLESLHENLIEIKIDADLFQLKFTSLRKQLYSSIDLLAHLFGFFCVPMRKIDCLKIKFNLLAYELNLQLPPTTPTKSPSSQTTTSSSLISINLNSSNDTYLTLFTITILNLMKCYLNLHQFKQLNDLNVYLIQKSFDKCSSDGDYDLDSFNLIEKNKLFSNKPEFIVTYYLINAHYCLLKQNFNDAVKIIKKKIVNSTILCGRQTAPYYEAKYYLKYLMFILSTINFGKVEITKQLQLQNETPLSILEECYQAVFSVARFYLQNSVEPTRVLVANANKNEITSNKKDSNGKDEPVQEQQLTNSEQYQLVFFNIGNAECYRILSDDLDIMQLLCKYYVELSRYREATCFIREGLDLTQLHYSTRRLTQFLLHQINTDLIASNLNEAIIRLDLAENLINETKMKSTDNFDSLATTSSNSIDIIKFKNFIHLNLLKITNLIKNQNYSECFKLVNKFIKLRSSLLNSTTPTTTAAKVIDVQKTQQAINLFNELFIEIYLNLCNAFKYQNEEHHSMNEKEKQLNLLINYLKQLLIDSKSTAILNEKWYLAEYYCLLYELNSSNNLNLLKLAFNLIKLNPHPYLYRRICLHMFEYLDRNSDNEVDSENDEDFDDNKIDLLTLKFDKIEVTSTSSKSKPSQTSTISQSSSILPLITPNSKQLHKCSYLLETQSIALRHKACSIHIKNKRKSAIDLNLYENLLDIISFNKKSLFKFYLNDIQTQIPSNLTVISLILDNNCLYLVRLEKNFEPFLYKLDNFDINFIEKFKQIIHDNDTSMKQNDRTKFWSLRNQLNKRLIEYLNDIDENLFKFSRYFLLASYLSDSLIKKCETEMKKFLKKFSLTPSKLTLEQKQIIYFIFNILFDNEFLNATTKQQVQIYLFDAFQYLRFSLKQCELFSNYLVDANFKDTIKNVKRKHVCLLIDKYLHQIPWECLPIIKQQTITRMPSIHFLFSHLQTCKMKIDKNKAFYIVDPGGDLIYTKQKFQTFFHQQANWDGIIGNAPDESEYKKALTEYDLFIYTGHGSGSQYYPSEDVQKLRVRACSILMGCSSGNQYIMGDFEPYGTILAYILAGCPCVVGNLWDVTDRDIDRFTEEFLQSWLKCKNKEKSNDSIINIDEDGKDCNEDNDDDDLANCICVHLNKARNACKMSHLNGSAPVIYGLPVSFK